MLLCAATRIKYYVIKMIKHHESQDNSIITMYLFMLDKRIGPQLLFFFPEIISFFVCLFETIGNKVF